MINTYTYTISQWLKRSKSFINKDLKKSEYNCNFYILDFIKSIIDKDLYKENINLNWKKTYTLVINDQLVFDWFWKNKAIKTINNWLKYLKTENRNYTFDWLLKSMIF